MPRSGFTLIEILIVISILTLMTSFLVLYNRAGESQIILFKEKANLIGALARAKNLAFGTLIENVGGMVVCGYGVYAESAGYFLYRDLAADCQASDRGYSGDGSGEKIVNDAFALSAAVKLSKEGISDILFVPPFPDVYFDGQRATGEAELVLSVIDGQTKVGVTVNGAGQISEK